MIIICCCLLGIPSWKWRYLAFCHKFWRKSGPPKSTGRLCQKWCRNLLRFIPGPCLSMDRSDQQVAQLCPRWCHQLHFDYQKNIYMNAYLLTCLVFWKTTKNKNHYQRLTNCSIWWLDTQLNSTTLACARLPALSDARACKPARIFFKHYLWLAMIL